MELSSAAVDAWSEVVAKNYVVSTVWKTCSEWMEYSMCSVWGAHDLLHLSQKILPSWWDCQSGIRWARSFPQKALMRCSLAGIEWRRLRMVTDSYLSHNLTWLRVKSDIDLMSPTKIDPQSVYKKNQNEISWGPGGVECYLAGWGSWESLARCAGLVWSYFAGRLQERMVLRVDPSYLPGISCDDNPNWGRSETHREVFFGLRTSEIWRGPWGFWLQIIVVVFLLWMPRWLVTMRELNG